MRVKQLLPGGADIEESGGCDKTRLLFATGSRHMDVVQLLLKHNASVGEAPRAVYPYIKGILPMSDHAGACLDSELSESRPI